MKKSRFSFALSLLLAAGAATGQEKAEPKSYEGQQVVRVTHRSGEELARVLELTESLWSEGIGRGPVDVQMSRENVELLKREGIQLEVLVEDLQADAERERAEIEARRAIRARGGDAIDYANYYPYADHVTFINQLVGERPDLASVGTIGNTLQGNPIWTVNVTGPGDASSRPQVAINSTIHAREWITTPSSAYLLENLVRGYDTDPRVRNLMDTVDWYVTPVFNVDGYLYSWSTERYWRKNRRNNGNGTFGVDINRNFDVVWGTTGASSNPADETYRGTGPASEPETQVMSAFLSGLDDLRAHVDTHSYSQLVLHAPGNFQQVVPNQAELFSVAEQMAQAILATNGAFYTPQRGLDLYEVSGGFSDWTTIELGAYGFTIEARPTGGGLNGFSPPASEIFPAVTEIYEAYLVMAELRTQPLRFVLPESAYANFQESESRPITFSVLGALNTPAASGVKVLARQGSTGSFTEIPATSLGNGMYSATLSAGDCDTTVEFYLQAMTSTGTTVSFPANGAGVPIVADVTADVLVFADNGETNEGWTVSGNAADGQWERAVPANFGRSDPASDFDGSGRCWLTDNAVSNSDVDGGQTILTSPVIDLSTGGVVGFAYWMNDETNTIGAEDFFRLEVSTNGGSTWTTARTYSPAGAWRTDTIDVGAQFGSTSQFRMRFVAAENDPGDVLECGVDAISVVVPGTCEPDTCLADANGDGILSPADFSAWVSAFNAMSAACDQNADGACTPADFSAWVANYNAGCN